MGCGDRGRELGHLREFIDAAAGSPGLRRLYAEWTGVPARISPRISRPLPLCICRGSPGHECEPLYLPVGFCEEVAQRRGCPMGLERRIPRKARFVLMLTDGVDPYNGSTSVNEPGQPLCRYRGHGRAAGGIPVYSIYFADAGIRGGRRTSAARAISRRC